MVLWDVARGRPAHVLSGHAAAVSNVAFAGDRLASISTDTSVKLWDAKTGQRVPLRLAGEAE